MQLDLSTEDRYSKCCSLGVTKPWDTVSKLLLALFKNTQKKTPTTFTTYLVTEINYGWGFLWQEIKSKLTPAGVDGCLSQPFKSMLLWTQNCTRYIWASIWPWFTFVCSKFSNIISFVPLSSILEFAILIFQIKNMRPELYDCWQVS